MKRLIPAAIIFILTVMLCVVSHTMVKKECAKTLKDVDDFYNQKITATALEKQWQSRKEKMSLFVNHSFLDDLTVYIGQLSLYDSNSEKNYLPYKNIQTVLTMIQSEHKLSAHSFY